MVHQARKENERLKNLGGAKQAPECYLCEIPMKKFSQPRVDSDERGDWLEVSTLWYCAECVDPTQFQSSLDLMNEGIEQ